jgi:hypothetical protein
VYRRSRHRHVDWDSIHLAGVTNEPPHEERGDYSRLDLIVAIVLAAMAVAWIVAYAAVIATNGLA